MVPDQKETGDKFLVKFQGERYDIHEFIRFHPGGRKTLYGYQGKSLDAPLKVHSHSRAAYHLLGQFAINRKQDYNDYESFVDWNKPLLRQVSSLGNRYWEWVNLPVNRPIRLFYSDLLELLTVTPWYLIPIFWIPTICYFFYLGCTLDIPDSIANHTVGVLVSYAVGVLIWTFLEYVLHRKIFHYKPPSNSKVLITLHFLLHGVHHKAPFDNQRLVFPPLAGIIVVLVLRSIWTTFLPLTMMNFIFTGGISGYMCYDLMHYYLHYGTPRPGTYFYNMKRNHNYHHFSHHELGFGISSTLWDYILETSINLPALDKPIEW
ncbi:fatty acid 2-hydroxylase [Prorops nasuta]|uniref:fatty acid 2-hydroxylase n=1 Tax=Prorops nasuta TaxID=863751 RepID=UPI0034CE5C4D